MYAPGIAAAPCDLAAGAHVAIYADVTDAAQRGGTTVWAGGSSRVLKESDVTVNGDNSVLVGWGVCQMGRGQVFGSGICVWGIFLMK